jgi:hypothetical protein
MFKYSKAFFIIFAVSALVPGLQAATSAAPAVEKMTIKGSGPNDMSTYHNSKGKILEKDLAVGGGIICKAGEKATFFANGQWEGCVIKNAYTYQIVAGKTIVFKAGTVLERWPNGNPKLATTGEGTRVEGLAIKINAPITFSDKATITSFVLASDSKIGLSPIVWKKDTLISFYPSGHIYEGSPAQDFKMGNVTIKAGLYTSFSEDGRSIGRLNHE